jgi:hypothetical protein
MRLDYYYGTAGLDSGDIKEIWRYGSGSGAAPFPKVINYDGNNDYSLYFTYEKLDANRCILVSNLDSGSNGYSLGLTDNNQIFIESYYNSGIRDKFVYNDIPLGKKNTLLVKKIGKYFGIYDYDIVSSGIRSYQGYSMSPSGSISGSNVRIGGNPYYHNSGFFNNFSGSFDQLLLTSEVYNSVDDEKILKGFLPETGEYNYSTFSREYSEDSVNWLDSIELSTNDYAYLKNFYTDFNTNLANSGASEYITLFSGNKSGSLLQVSGTSYTRVDECTATTPSYNYTYSALAATGMNFSFSGTISSIYKSGSGNLLVEYRNRFDYSGQNFDNSHYFNEIWNTSTTHVSGGYDTGYYSGFLMNGLSSPSSTGVLVQLKNESCLPSKINSFAQSNLVNGGFSLDSDNLYPNRVFVDGVEDYTFSNSGNLLTTSLSGNEVIYDSTTTPFQFQHLSLNRFTTGNFHKYSSIAFSGVNSWSQLYRLRLNADYKETSEYHLFHGKKVSNSNDLDLTFDDSSNFWI